MVKIHQLRGGAPDKIQLWHLDLYKLIHEDHTNLVNYSDEDLMNFNRQVDFISPADEGDIKRANEFWNNHPVDQSFILLPQIRVNEDTLKVIPYYDFVPKDSKVYQELEENTGIKYPKFECYTIQDFENLNLDSDRVAAYKTTTGSGSRGVLLIDPERVHLGYKYRDHLNMVDMNNFLAFAKKEGCNIMIQELIPYAPGRLFKTNVDFIIRNGRLLGYKWTKTDPADVFTNWNFGWHIRNEYTDSIMQKLGDYLTKKLGIVNAIMNFEAFSDFKSETWMVEINWRYSNSSFEWEAAGIDLFFQYLKDEPFDTLPEYGMKKFSRYWRCMYYEDIQDYNGVIDQ